MTRCNLLNISEIKQIVPRSQISPNRSTSVQCGSNVYPLHKARHKGNQLVIPGYTFSYLASNPFIWSKTTVGYLYSDAQSKVRKSLRRASAQKYCLKLANIFFYITNLVIE